MATTYLSAVLTAHQRDEPADELSRLAADLGHLPLALSQAVAYIIDADTDCAAYRRLLADRARTLTDVLPERDELPDDQAVTVAAAWSMSIERADRMRPAGLARRMLQLAALLAPNGMPVWVLSGPACRMELAAARAESPRRDTQALDDVSLEDAVSTLQALHRLSLVDLSMEGPRKRVRVHQLVQRAAREAASAKDRPRLVRAIADDLLTAWPEHERDFEFTQLLRANTESLLSQTDEETLFRPYVHAVLHQLGTSLGESGQYARAATHFRWLADKSTEYLGPDHDDTIAAHFHHARWLGEDRATAECIRVSESLLDQLLRVHGPEHHYTLALRNNIARWRGESGDPQGAVAEFKELIPILERALGADAPPTLLARSNLADWRGYAGDVERAVAELTLLIPSLERELSADDPTLLGARHALIHWRSEAGDTADEPAALLELFTAQVEMCGRKHPTTLATGMSLAIAYGEAGDADTAVAVLQDLLPQYVEALGWDDPETLKLRGHLAYWQGSAGYPQVAAVNYGRLLPAVERVLGADHSETLALRSLLAYWLWRSGDPLGAAEHYSALLESTQSAMGTYSSEALDVCHSLAACLRETDDAPRTAMACEELERLLPHFEAQLGPDHHHIINSRLTLAQWRTQSGDWESAAGHYGSLLSPLLQVLGPDHENTLAVRHNHAACLEKAGNLTAAADAFQKLLRVKEQLLDPADPEMLVTQTDLANCLEHLGDASRAEHAYAALLLTQKRLLGRLHERTLTTRYRLDYWRRVNNPLRRGPDGGGPIRVFGAQRQPAEAADGR
ncbi:tetratricopeptide repeat protein [Streptomyces sp. NPDC054855]